MKKRKWSAPPKQEEMELTSLSRCSECGHHTFLHGEDGCEVRILQSGYESFADLPRCGCKEHPKE